MHTIYRYLISYRVYCHTYSTTIESVPIEDLKYICTDGTHNYHNDTQKTMNFLEEYPLVKGSEMTPTKHRKMPFCNVSILILVYNVLTTKKGWQILLKYNPSTLFHSKG